MHAARIGWFPGLVVACLVAVGGTGCSSYRRDARQAALRPSAGVEGLWVGRWHDEKNPSHGGELRCVLTRDGALTYRLSSRSRWWKWFVTSLDATVVVTPVSPAHFEIRGGRGIWPFGDYSLECRLEGDRLEGFYEAGGRRGRIELRRAAHGERG